MNHHSIPEAAREWLITQGFGDVIDAQQLNGGSICNVRLLQTLSGNHFVIKTHTHSDSDLFISEAENISTLQRYPCSPTPKVFHADKRFILMEYIKDGLPHETYWELLAKQTALMHQNTQEKFGFHIDNYCGGTRQINTYCNDGYTFFAECRLNYQAQLAFNSHQFTSKDVANVEALSNQLESLIPVQKPSLLHGDFWSGNLYCNKEGNPVLLDPACYWGWRETDISISKLFNGFDERFYQTYQDIYPMEHGWENRMDIYNLYHLLNHLNLFGGNYLHAVRNILRKYT